MMATKLKYKRRNKALVREYWQAYIIFLPVFIWFFIFCYLPMGGLIIGFKKFSVLKGIANSPWVGWANFTQLFSTPTFINSIKNTLIISALNLFIGFPIPIIFAIMLDEQKNMRFKKVVQTVSYLPHFISWSVAGGMVYMLLSPSTGAITAMIKALGGESQNFLGISKYFRTIVVTSGIWKSMGWGAIIYLAAITSVDAELYEAAMIDGAGRFARIWNVTLPGIRNIIAIQLILQVGQIMNVNFDQIFILLNDLTRNVGETIDYYIYRVGLSSSNNFSLATASGMFKSVIGLFMIVGTNMICKKLTDGEGGIW